MYSAIIARSVQGGHFSMSVMDVAERLLDDNRTEYYYNNIGK